MGYYRKTTVIIPGYNCAMTLAATVESVILSGLTELEIIIVDDGSTDGTAEICEELSGRYDNVFFYRQSNSGVSAARNKGIELAHGDYILFVDSDDKLRPFDTRKIEKLMADNTDVIAFGMSFQYIKNGVTVREESMSCGNDLVMSAEELAGNFAMLFDCNYLSTSCNKFIRRSILTDNLLRFDSRLTNYEDLEFSVRLLPYIGSFAALEEPYYLYYIEDGNDHTPERVSKIRDIVANTDIIASSFTDYRSFVRSVYGMDVPFLSDILLSIYIGLIICKAQTCKYYQIKRICMCFAEDKYVSGLLDKSGKLSRAGKWVLRFLTAKQPLKLLCFLRCLEFRNSAVLVIKRILKIER